MHPAEKKKEEIMTLSWDLIGKAEWIKSRSLYIKEEEKVPAPAVRGFDSPSNAQKMKWQKEIDFGEIILKKNKSNFETQSKSKMIVPKPI